MSVPGEKGLKLEQAHILLLRAPELMYVGDTWVAGRDVSVGLSLDHSNMIPQE